MSAAPSTWTGTLSAQEHEAIVNALHGSDETFHIASTYSDAAQDRANGNGYRHQGEAMSVLRDIRKHTPHTRLTVFRVTVDVVTP